MGRRRKIFKPIEYTRDELIDVLINWHKSCAAVSSIKASRSRTSIDAYDLRHEEWLLEKTVELLQEIKGRTV